MLIRYMYRPICVYEHGYIADAFSYHIVTVNADAAYFDVSSANFWGEMITVKIGFR